ncbi:hypothetical protein [Motilimonas sp. E26]|uniref:hypothetical protein n=1 Tax=Motilimonas sp. E26 TaxID=2865674 RepID=UPI001E630BDB|nr:hypothetical protein [Motilimonas sp. E26]MCE0556218.1 hypothetical protein [Motilimonas sp. E26]
MQQITISWALAKLEQACRDYPALTISLANNESWQHFCHEIKVLAPEYQWQLGDYAQSYNSFSSCETLRLPIMVFQDGKPAAIWPLNIHSVVDEYHILSNSSPVLPPMFKSVLAEKSQKSIIQCCLKSLYLLADDLSVKKLTTCTIEGWNHHELWTKAWMMQGAQLQASHECFVDLTLSTSLYRKQLSKGCKSTIKQALSLWDFELITYMSTAQRDAFSYLHQQVAGRITRSSVNWETQRRLTEQGLSFAIFVYDKGKLIGAAQFLTSTELSAYAIAAYDRSLFQFPIAHGVQWLAIEHMRSCAIKTYHIGARCYQGEWFQPSEKEQDIGQFKASFASEMRLKQTLILDIQKVT